MEGDLIKRKEDDFYYEPVSGWNELFERLKELTQEPYRKWIFKGLLSEWHLESTFDRAFYPSNINETDRQNNAIEIEKKLTRDFRRLYDGSDRQAVLSDTLYCISLMQHHGAPTRIMDFTYSPFIAAYFALEYAWDKDKKEDNKLHGGKINIAIWCFNTKWCRDYLESNEKLKQLMDNRLKKDIPSEKSFLRIYMPSEPFTFVYPENPYLLHTRLARQQGVFLCPGDVSKSFSKNLKALVCESEECAKESIYEIRCELCRPQRLEALNQLHRMNIDRASLFPGLDGFAESMKYRFKFYFETAQEREAKSDC